MKFGEYLRKARDKKGWTQPEASAKIGIEQSYLSKVEAGKSYPSEEVFDEIVKAYDINVDNMSTSVSSDELDKLRDAASVRAAILKQQKTATGNLRGWMLTGLVMIMLGAGLLIGQSELSETNIITYRYQSQGAIHPEEPILIFQQLTMKGSLDFKTCQKKAKSAPSSQTEENCQALLQAANEALAARTNYDIKDTVDYLGPNFVISQENGDRRRYELVDKIKSQQKSWLNYLHAVGVALLIGGFISCFYISQHWR